MAVIAQNSRPFRIEGEQILNITMGKVFKIPIGVVGLGRQDADS
jgi:hypothetical protein